MKLLYTNENYFLVHNIKNIVENAGVSTTLRNEYTSSGAGELAPNETWLELWVINENQYGKAILAIRSAFHTHEKAWVCKNCLEKNGAAFEFCWQCQTNP